MPCLSEAEVKNLLEDVLAKQGLVDQDCTIEDGSNKGDGYMSFMTKVDVADLHVLIKAAPRDLEFRKMMPLLRPIYLREILFYETVFPAMATFQKDLNVAKPFDCVAKCYKTIETEGGELLVLENMRRSGFSLWNRKLCMDVEHIGLVLEEYGKFHATGFAIKDQRPGLYEELTKDMDDLFKPENATEEMKAMSVKLLEKVRDMFVDNEGVYAALTRFMEEQDDFMVALSKEGAFKHGTITHGDCWCNNMMFAYRDSENPNRPTDLCLLDFQLAKPASPVLDVSYFFYAMASKEMLDNLDHYLRIYHKSLGDHLRELGSDVEKLYPFSALKAEWNKYAKFGFVMSLVVLKAMLREKDEVVDFTDGNDDGKTFISAFEDDIRSEAFAERQRNLVLHAFEIGII